MRSAAHPGIVGRESDILFEASLLNQLDEHIIVAGVIHDKSNDLTDETIHLQRPPDKLSKVLTV